MRLLISVVLTGLCVAVVGQVAEAGEPNALGMSAQAVANKGTLFICGGGRAPEPVYQEFVRLSGGRKARIVLITSAYAYRDEEHVQHRFAGWRSMGAESLMFLDAKSREEADSSKFIQPLTRATSVWIAGGSQSRLMSLCAGTKTEQAVRDVLNRGGVVGGTSAGAAAMSQLMIRYGCTSAVLGQGIGLLSGAVVDQHFSQRGRYGRLLGVLDEHPGLLGIGVDERTAAVVQGNMLRVLGESQVAVCVPAPGQATMVYRFKSNQQAARGCGVGPEGRGLRLQRPARQAARVGGQFARRWDFAGFACPVVSLFDRRIVAQPDIGVPADVGAIPMQVAVRRIDFLFLTGDNVAKDQAV